MQYKPRAVEVCYPACDLLSFPQRRALHRSVPLSREGRARSGQPAAEAPAPRTGELLPASKPPPRPPCLSPAPRPLSPCGFGCCSACCCCRRRCRTVSRRDPIRAATGGPLPTSPPRAPLPPPAMSGAGGHLGVWGLPSCVAATEPVSLAGDAVCSGQGVGMEVAGGVVDKSRCLFVSLRHGAQSRRSSPAPVLRRVGAALGAPFHNNANVT